MALSELFLFLLLSTSRKYIIMPKKMHATPFPFTSRRVCKKLAKLARLQNSFQDFFCEYLTKNLFKHDKREKIGRRRKKLNGKKKYS